MSGSKKQKSTLAYILDMIKLLIILPIYCSFILDAISDVNKIQVNASDVNEIINQEFSGAANVIIMMMLKMFLVFAVLEIISIIVLQCVKRLKKG